MTDKLGNESPLVYGKLAPDFELESVDGKTFTRGQFRGKSALVLIFFQPTTEVQTLLDKVGEDSDEYNELNVRVFAIARATRDELKPLAAALHPSITLLADPAGEAWKAYSGTDQPGYAVFVLDMYGGVDAQKVATSPSELPNAKTILGWATAAQYRCNI
jgi:peroxiredoxin